MAETIAANTQLRNMLRAMVADIPPQFVAPQQATQKKPELPALQTQKTGQ